MNRSLLRTVFMRKGSTINNTMYVRGEFLVVGCNLCDHKFIMGDWENFTIKLLLRL